MRIEVAFEYDTEHKVYRVLSRIPGIGTSVLHDSHFVDDAKKELNRAVLNALRTNLDAITAVRLEGQ